MIRHLFLLVWNRKRENALIILELIAAFVVVFFICGNAAYQVKLYNEPLGFDYADMHAVQISVSGEWSESDGKTLEQVLLSLRSEPSVRFAHVVRIPMFVRWRWTNTFNADGVEFNAMMNAMTADAPDALSMRLLDGRWFDESDLGQADDYVVINRLFAQKMFGDESPLGKNIRETTAPEEEVQPTIVVGVFEDFRHQGEFAELSPYVIGQHDLSDYESSTNSLIVGLAKDAPLDAEQEMQRRIETLAPEWRVRITPLSVLRDGQIRDVVIPMILGGVVAGFLLLMVAFGIFGVLWQNVTRRTGELGLRRALGAARSAVYRQIMLETVSIAILALIVGALITIQFPMLGTFPTINWETTAVGITIGAALITGLCTLCALYPAWLASRKEPAEALHYE